LPSADFFIQVENTTFNLAQKKPVRSLGLGHTAHPSLFKLPYDLEKDFVAITRVASLPLLLVVSNDLKATTIGELVALAKARPGALNYASAGNGTSQHLAMEMFSSLSGVKMQHVPYKGIGPALTDMLTGRIDALMSPIASALPMVRAGKLRAIGVTAVTRFSLVPDVPTIAEAGFAGFQIDTWHGLVTPAGTPREIVAKLNDEVIAVLQLPEMRESFAKLGALPSANSPVEFAAEIKSEIARWGRLIRESGIKGD
jgi:tripartite-type tricarboxylate transporter receptor subunit TctC